VPELPPDPATLAIADDATFVDTPRWSIPTRIAFRFAFCYFLLYALCCGNATAWEVIPFHIGEHIENWLVWPFKHGAQWLVQHHSHITGVGAKLHDTGSGDTVIDWTAHGDAAVDAVRSPQPRLPATLRLVPLHPAPYARGFHDGLRLRQTLSVSDGPALARRAE
jgi:hypothetical protein